MNTLSEYAEAVVAKAGQSFVSCEVFGKVLSPNDDSGRHGLLIPTRTYSFFPDFQISDPAQNATLEFSGFNSIDGIHVLLAYKYYKRYPERRITCLPSLINDRTKSPRIVVCLRVRHSDGSTGYYFDCGVSGPDGRFDYLFRLVFGTEVAATPGRFIIRQVDSADFTTDSSLAELLEKFDHIKARGWIDTLRPGDTGIGYTFETLLGIDENNDQTADFKGIEIKCKGKKENGATTGSKINLFQAAPKWLTKMSDRDRVRQLGVPGATGLYACYSQLTTSPNNLDLFLDVLHASNRIDLCKAHDAVGFWSFERLAGRLAEKHSRAAFINAKVRKTKSCTQYSYDELVYCDRPSIERFVGLVDDRSIVLEITMSEKPDSPVRNHGYPWRLIRAEFLDQLFAFQIKLR